MRDYKIKKLLIKDRGVDKTTKGIFNYSANKIDKFERLLVDNKSNIEIFEKFKDDVVNRREVSVSASMCYFYTGFVLENNMVINIKKDALFRNGEYVQTPKGKIRFIQLPSGMRCLKDKDIEEDIEAMTESIYELDYSRYSESLFYANYKFELTDGRTVIPRLVVSVPSIRLKPEYQGYFYLANDREKLEYKLQNQIKAGLREIIEMDEKLPEQYREEHKSWTPEKRVYEYICKNPAFIYGEM